MGVGCPTKQDGTGWNEGTSGREICTGRDCSSPTKCPWIRIAGNQTSPNLDTSLEITWREICTCLFLRQVLICTAGTNEIDCGKSNQSKFGHVIEVQNGGKFVRDGSGRIIRPLLNVHRLKLREIKPVQMWTRHRGPKWREICTRLILSPVVFLYCRYKWNLLREIKPVQMWTRHRGPEWREICTGRIIRPLLNVHRLKLREIKPVQMWTRHRLYRKSQDCSLRQQGQDLMSGPGAPTQNTQTEHLT